MMRRVLLSIFVSLLLFTPVLSFAAYDSGICTADACTLQEVGPFMEGISKACGNTGTCSLEDIMTVFVNMGNYVLGVIGAVVLLMYVIGGIYLLSSGGAQERVTKGKKYITVSTIGLIIVMFAYLGILSLKGGLIYGDFSIYSSGVEGLYTCTEDTVGQPCDLNSTCTEDLQCVSICEQTKTSQTETTAGGKTVIESYECIDLTTYPTSSDTSGKYYGGGTCYKNLCPGNTQVQCCAVYTLTND